MTEFYTHIYNKETKERFIRSIDPEQYPPRWWERVFEKTYIFENSKQKDLCCFNTSEILEFYKFLDCTSLTSLMVYNINLVKYAQWALNENLIVDGQNHFAIIDNELLNSCVNKLKLSQTILSYDDFMELIIRKIVNYQDKYIFFCLFEGIKGKDFQEIINLQMSDIEGNVAHLCSGRDVQVPDDFVNVCIQANQQTTYVGLSENNVEKPLIPSINILKEKHNSQGNLSRSIYRTIVRNSSTILGLSEAVNTNSIKNSGFVYYLNKRADQLGISVEELFELTDKCEDIISKYQFNIKTKKRWILQYQDFLH